MSAYRTTKILGPDGKFLTVKVSAPYEAAGQGRRGMAWRASSSGPNTALTGNLGTIRNRSRDAYRNNPWVGLAIDRIVSNEVGVGLIPRCRAKGASFRERVTALWDRSAAEFDADGVLDVYGLQALVSRTRNMAGECFTRLRQRRLDDGLAVPFQVQVLEPEFCPVSENRTAPNGNLIRAGIEFNAIGRRVAYWMYRSHPGELAGLAPINDLVRIPAEQVIHHYLPTRPGQIRGEPITVQSLMKAKTFDTYDDAELTRKQTRAPFTGAVQKPAPDYGEADWKYDPLTGEPLTTDEDGIPTVDAQPGTFLNLLPGESLQLFSGDDAGEGYADFMRQQLLGIAAGIGIPYEVMTGDWSKVNDRLVRAILHEFRRWIQSMQDHLMIFQVCRAWWINWMDTAVLSGALQARGYADRRAEYLRHEWRAQGWPYLHPVQDIQAKVTAIANGLDSRAAAVAERGYDVEEIDQQNAEDAQRAKDMGLPYKIYQDQPAEANSAKIQE